MSLQDLLNTLETETQAMEESAKRPVFGKLTYTVDCVAYLDGAYKPISEEEFAALEGQKDNKTTHFRQMTIDIDPRDFTGKDWTTSRRVRILANEKHHDKVQTAGKNAGKALYVPSDWSATVAPSIKKVFGSIRAFKPETWVKAFLVASQTNAATETWSVIKFDKLYADQDACYRDWFAVYGAMLNKSVTDDLPADELPGLEQARELWATVGSDKDLFAQAAQMDPLLNTKTAEYWLELVVK